MRVSDDDGAGGAVADAAGQQPSGPGRRDHRGSRSPAADPPAALAVPAEGGAHADRARRGGDPGQGPVTHLVVPDVLRAASCGAGRQNPDEEFAPTVWVRWAA